MPLLLTGEDGCTLYSIMTDRYLKIMKNDLDLQSIENIWFRPSFGRGAGPKIKEEEKGYSGFGESDAIIIAKDASGRKNIVFLESKKGNINSEKSMRDLRYQFFLKMALIYGIKHPAKKKMGIKKTEKTYYCVELNDSNSPISKILYKYYKEYKNNASSERRNGWMILKNSPSSPALVEIENILENSKDNLSFSFYALGFNNNIESIDPIDDLFKDTDLLPNEIKELFSINGSLKIVFRNIKMGSDTLKLALPT